MSWLPEVCRFAIEQGIDVDQLRQLDAFGWVGERAATCDSIRSFEALEDWVDQYQPKVAEQIVLALEDEVDVAQAELFGRRVFGVMDFMEGLRDKSPWVRVLRVTLAHRMPEILDVSHPPVDKPPRALRVRAIADYFFSLAAVEYHRLVSEAAGQEPMTLASMVASMEWTEEDQGLWSATIEGQTKEGPFRASMLRLDVRRYHVQAVHRVLACEQGETLADSADALGASAAVSGGFFLYSEPDIAWPSHRYDPVDLLISDGWVINPPCFGRVAFMQRRSGVCEIRRVHLCAMSISGEGVRVVVDEKQWMSFTRTQGEIAPKGYRQWSIANGQVIAYSANGGLPVPLNGFVLMTCLETVLSWDKNTRVQIEWPPEEDPVVSAMAGGPQLLGDEIDLRRDGFVGSAPPRTFSGDETGDCNLLPRMAVGLQESGDVVFAAVDGRNFERALGVTLTQLSELMGHLECTVAMNLDGGSSKRMVIGQTVRDLPTTDIIGGAVRSVRVRPVRTALFWFPTSELKCAEDEPSNG